MIEIPPQLFLGTLDKVYFIDKAENNPTQIKGHPAWASGTFWFCPLIRMLTILRMGTVIEYSEADGCGDKFILRRKQFLFNFAPTLNGLQGGSVLGNGTWLNVGGNEAVTYGGVNSNNSDIPYHDPDGRNS